MRHIFLFLFFFTALSTAKSIEERNYFDYIEDDDDGLKIVRPENYKKAKSPNEDILLEMEQDNVIPEEPGQIGYVEYIIDDEDDDDDSSDSDSFEEVSEQDAQETARSIADYADYGDDDSPVGAKQDWKRRLKDEDEMKKIEDISPAELKRAENEAPMLAIDPPRPAVPDFSVDNLPETGSKDISVIPVVVSESIDRRENVINVPRDIRISVDISHLLLIGLAGILLFWLIRRVFAYYHRSRPVTVCPAEEGSVHKVPLE